MGPRIDDDLVCAGRNVQHGRPANTEVGDFAAIDSNTRGAGSSYQRLGSKYLQPRIGRLKRPLRKGGILASMLPQSETSAAARNMTPVTPNLRSATRIFDPYTPQPQAR